MFLESIRILKCKPQLIKYHNERVNNTLKVHYGTSKKINLANFIDTSNLEPSVEYKCRVIYDRAIQSVELLPYVRRSIYSIQLVKMMNTIEYPYKRVERNELDQLYSMRGKHDEIIILNNQGFVTDAYYYNIILAKDGKLYTPDTCLLNGVMRASLLNKSILDETKIHKNDIPNYDKIFLVNAMNPLGTVSIEISNIHFPENGG